MPGLYPKLGFDTLHKPGRSGCYGLGPDFFVIQNLQPVSLSGFKQPFNPSPAITGKFEQKFSLMASVCYMSHMMRQKKSVGPGHAWLLTPMF